MRHLLWLELKHGNLEIMGNPVSTVLPYSTPMATEAQLGDKTRILLYLPTVFPNLF